jgi:amidase
MGILHGIPVSIKDMIKAIGTPATCGLAVYIDRIAIEDGALVQMLLENGAVPYVKTNIP